MSIVQKVRTRGRTRRGPYVTSVRSPSASTSSRTCPKHPGRGTVDLCQPRRLQPPRPDSANHHGSTAGRSSSQGRGRTRAGGLLRSRRADRVAPGSACTQTYLIAGMFDIPRETENYAYYLTTKFARFLVLQRKTTQDVTPDRFRFVPTAGHEAPLDRRRPIRSTSGSTEEEAAYIEATIHPREPILSLDSPIPASHLAGRCEVPRPGARDEPRPPTSRRGRRVSAGSAGRIYVYSRSWLRHRVDPYGGATTSTGRGRFKVGYTGRPTRGCGSRSRPGPSTRTARASSFTSTSPLSARTAPRSTTTRCTRCSTPAGVHRSQRGRRGHPGRGARRDRSGPHRRAYDPSRTEDFGMRPEQAAAVEQTARTSPARRRRASTAFPVEREDAVREDVHHLPARQAHGVEAGPGPHLQARGPQCVARRPRQSCRLRGLGVRRPRHTQPTRTRLTRWCGSRPSRTCSERLLTGTSRNTTSIFT